MIDTVPVPVAPGPPGKWALSSTCTPPMVPVAADDTGGTTTTVPPHSGETVPELSSTLSVPSVPSHAGGRTRANNTVPHHTTGPPARTSPSELGTYLITVGASAVPIALVCLAAKSDDPIRETIGHSDTSDHIEACYLWKVVASLLI